MINQEEFLFRVVSKLTSRNSVEFIVSGLRAGGSGFECRTREYIFLFSKNLQISSGSHPIYQG